MTDISSFIEWFLTQFVTIGTFMVNKLNQIQIYNNVTLLEFIITITIIGMFVTIILTIPQNANKISARAERRQNKK